MRLKFEFAASLVRPLAGTLIPSYRRAVDVMDMAVIGVIDAEGGAVNGEDDDDGQLEATIIRGPDDSDDEEDNAVPKNNTSPPKIMTRKTFVDDDA